MLNSCWSGSVVEWYPIQGWLVARIRVRFFVSECKFPLWTPKELAARLDWRRVHSATSSYPSAETSNWRII
eukprot:5578615-Amphidinium_carterae.1